MKKRTCIIFQIVLLLWFFLDMTGFSFGDFNLVTRAYKDDGLFFLIYLVAVVLFICKENIGKWFVAVWTTMWFIIQFLCHEWYTIFDGGCMGTLEGKIEYFADNFKWLSVSGKYIPDLYHTVLHIFILLVVVSSWGFVRKSGDRILLYQNKKGEVVTGNVSTQAIYKTQEAFRGVAEEIGVYNDDDVQALVDEVRNGKEKS